MDDHRCRDASRGLRVGVCALACASAPPLMIIGAIATGYVIRSTLALVGLLAFVASIPLGIVAWRMGSRELRLHVALSGAGNPPRQATLARDLGKAAVALAVLLVLFAILTYTEKMS